MNAHIEQFNAATQLDAGNAFRGAEHPYSGLTPNEDFRPPAEAGDNLDVPPMRVAQTGERPQLEMTPIYDAGRRAVPEIPAPVQQAIAEGKPIRFSTSVENGQAKREPDFFFTPEGQLVANPKATPSPDGSINIEIQNPDKENNQSLSAAITHSTEMQKQAAQEMIRLFQKAHPGQPVPSWMEDLVNAKPNIPDFVPFSQPPNAPASAPPENGFVNRGIGGGGGGPGAGGGGGGDAGFAGNGGFDSGGYFKGNGSSGDGAIPTGGTSSQGEPLGQGEQVQAKQLYDYFIEKGFTPAQSSGILGNIQAESSFRTDAYNSNENAIGLCQWQGGRRTALEAFAKDQGKPVTDWRVQADFIMHEFATSESSAYAAVKAAQTPAEAAVAFQSKFERSASIGNRRENASNIYSQLA
ncbi:MAG: hypothetical protein IT342_14475 [Candidatus Melainabacteria bacterium]|nr:hypothetical protein [Candidatus Melainabacteria bacterium]